jgi:dihydrofolate synthase/folylpolyglutamate synthase
MAEKDVKGIASILFPTASPLILTRPDNPRALPPEDLLAAVPSDFDTNELFLEPTTAAAVDKARELSGQGDLILVTGTLYLVGEVRGMLTAEPPEKLKTNN